MNDVMFYALVIVLSLTGLFAFRKHLRKPHVLLLAGTVALIIKLVLSCSERNPALVIYLLLIGFALPVGIVLTKRCDFTYRPGLSLAFTGIALYNLIGSYVVLSDPQFPMILYALTITVLVGSFYLFLLVSPLLMPPIHYGKCLSLNENEAPIFITCVLWGISVWALVTYFARNGSPPLLSLNFKESMDIYAIRGEKSTNLAEGMTFYGIAFSQIPYFLITYAYSLCILNSRFKSLFYINLVVGVFFLSLFLSKSVYVQLILLIFCVRMVLTPNWFNMRKVLLYLFVGLASITLMIRLYVLDREFWVLFQDIPRYIFMRISADYGQAHAHVLRIFPNQHDFFYGRAFANPGGILPFQPVDLSQFLGFWINGRLENFSMPSYSQGYANFGFMGMVLIICIMFFQIVAVQQIFSRLPANCFYFSIFILLTFKMIRYAIEPIQLIITEETILFVILLVVVRYFARAANRHLVETYAKGKLL